MKSYMLGVCSGLPERVCENLRRELSMLDHSELRRVVDPAADVFRPSGCAFSSDETAQYVHFALSFCFEHPNVGSNVEQRLTTLAALKMLALHAASDQKSVNYSSPYSCAGKPLAQHLTDKLGLDQLLDMKVKLYEYDTKTLMSFVVKCNKFNKDSTREIMQHLLAYIKQLPKVKQNQVKALAKRAVWAERNSCDQGSAYTEHKLRNAFMLSPQHYDITSKFSAITAEQINEHIATLNLREPSLAAVGDCPLLDSSF